MYQLFLILTGVALLAGCTSFRTLGTPEQPTAAPQVSESIETPSQPKPQSSKEEHMVETLFAQPYIDPLTRYLENTRGNTGRADLRQRVRDERNHRCEVIAARYNAEPVTESARAAYRNGYEYSCASDVDAYAQRLATLKAQTPPEPEPALEKEAAPPELSKQLNDCYLLTAIRNFSEALKACQQPADQGDVKAQTNMALMTFALKDYTSAFHWASTRPSLALTTGAR
jgi:hypothetical protein